MHRYSCRNARQQRGNAALNCALRAVAKHAADNHVTNILCSSQTLIVASSSTYYGRTKTAHSLNTKRFAKKQCKNRLPHRRVDASAFQRRTEHSNEEIIRQRVLQAAALGLQYSARSGPDKTGSLC